MAFTRFPRLGSALCATLLLLTGTACSGEDEASSDATGGSPSTGGSGSGGENLGGGSNGGDDEVILFDFADDIAGFDVADPAQTEGELDLSALAELTWDGDEGQPEAGSLRIEAPFGAYEEFVDYQHIFDEPRDLSGLTLFLSLKLASGFSPDHSAPGGIILYAKSGEEWLWGQAPWANVGEDAVDRWVEHRFYLDFPDTESSIEGFDPSAIRAIGFKIHTGGGVDASGPPASAVFFVDTIGYRP